ncbi:proteasome maturation protein [Macrosteles quadrilineatus]|uniref:proteasome maturation protein n=1 Tax=Macrosteles quadrilineatus TaxID=74068 RepID=UPI0023E0AE33|nr:proteasome maturation protein [Macrosteles quadrilineatus]
MSFGLNHSEVKPTHSVNTMKENSYGLPDVLTYGLGKVRDNVVSSHPVEESEKNFVAMQERREMTILRNTQGLHAPLRLAMERRAAQQVGRLPFLPSSNLQLEVLRGDDVTLDFNDILNTPDMREGLYQPHAVVERNLGLL